MFTALIATVFLSILVIYLIRLYKSNLTSKKEEYQAFLSALPPDPILAKSKQIFTAFRASDHETLKTLLSSIDPIANPEEHLKVLYDYSFYTKPHLAHLIISSARLDTLQILMDAKLININDLFLVHHAIKNLKSNPRQQEILQLLLDSGADLNLADKKGFPPIAVAILFTNILALNFLTDNWAKINVAFARSPSILHYAVTRSEIDHKIIQNLLQNGANVFHYGPDGRTAFHHILTMRPYNPTLIEIFLSNHDPYINSEEYAKKLLNYPTSTKKVKKHSDNTRYGYTPLHIAVAAYNTKLAQLLLSKGANARKIDTSGLTPIELAKQLKQHKMIKIFQ